MRLNLQIRRAQERDYDRIADLTYYGANVHRHLDWSSPLEWLGSSNYWVREEWGRLTAALACPEEPPRIAWIRFFGHSREVSDSQAWHSLWEEARRAIGESKSGLQFAAIALQGWFQALLSSSGFETRQSIVMLELKPESANLKESPPGVHIRPMRVSDLPAVAQVDLEAFGGFWHNTEAALRKALPQCASATVAEKDFEVIGYQISAQNQGGAHLARLAVKPGFQGQGVASALVSGLVLSFGAGISRLSVNTQSDNAASLALYKKLGFSLTGERFPVFVYPKANE